MSNSPIAQDETYDHLSTPGCHSCAHGKRYPGGREEWMNYVPIWCVSQKWRCAPTYVCDKYEGL